jgi:hypothetical protein
MNRASSGWERFASRKNVPVFQRKMPAFQKNFPLFRYVSARAASGFSTKRFTGKTDRSRRAFRQRGAGLEIPEAGGGVVGPNPERDDGIVLRPRAPKPP